MNNTICPGEMVRKGCYARYPYKLENPAYHSSLIENGHISEERAIELTCPVGTGYKGPHRKRSLRRTTCQPHHLK